MVLPRLFMGDDEAAAAATDAATSNTSFLQHQMFDSAANSMRQAPSSHHGLSAQEQLQGILMGATPATAPTTPSFLRQEQSGSSASQFTASGGGGGGNMFSDMPSNNSNSQQSELLAQFRQQQQQQQQFFNEASSRAGDNSSLLGGAGGMGPSLQEMMFMQQQQQFRGNDAAFGSGSGGGASFRGTGQAFSGQHTSFMQQHQQQQFNQQQQPMQPMGQQQMWMNEPMSLQDQFFQQQQHQQQQQQQQQQQMMGNLFGMSQQNQFEPNLLQRRRRSSISEAESVSPIGNARRQSLGDNLIFGNPEYARFLASSLMQQQQQQQQQPFATPLMENDALMGGMMAGNSGIGGFSGIGGMMTGNSSARNPLMLRKEKKKRAKSFPEKLMMAMIENASEQAVAWLPDGKSFVIVSPDLFVSEVLNSVFKQAKYASFVRKLHRWGFVRLTSGTGTDCFHHPLFNRNHREWASKITCATGAGARDAASGSGSMNMSAMDAVNTASAVSGMMRDSSLPMTMIKTTKAAASRPASGGMEAGSLLMGMGRSNDLLSDTVTKPPSLAGVERFIQARPAHSATASAHPLQHGDSPASSSSGGDMRSPNSKASFLPTMAEDKMYQGKEGEGNLCFSDSKVGGNDLAEHQHLRTESFMPSRLDDRGMMGAAGGIDALNPIKMPVVITAKNLSPESEKSLGMGLQTEV